MSDPFGTGPPFSMSDPFFNVGMFRRGRAGQKNAIALQETKRNEEPISAAADPGVLPMGNSGYGELNAATFRGHKENKESKASNTFHNSVSKE